MTVYETQFAENFSAKIDRFEIFDFDHRSKGPETVY